MGWQKVSWRRRGWSIREWKRKPAVELSGRGSKLFRNITPSISQLSSNSNCVSITSLHFHFLPSLGQSRKEMAHHDLKLLRSVLSPCRQSLRLRRRPQVRLNSSKPHRDSKNADDPDFVSIVDAPPSLYQPGKGTQSSGLPFSPPFLSLRLFWAPGKSNDWTGRQDWLQSLRTDLFDLHCHFLHVSIPRLYLNSIIEESMPLED